MSYKRFFILLLYTVLLTYISWILNGQSLIGVDDANIYMIYMRNLAAGNGFVYSIGGEHVEGCTSLLWTLIGAGYSYFTDTPEIVLLFTNIILITYSIYAITSFFDSHSTAIFSQNSLMFLGIIAFTPGFIDWTVLSLLETGLWTFLLTITTLHILRYNNTTPQKHYRIIFSLYCILLTVCRPEAMVWVPVFIGIFLLKEYTLRRSLQQSLYSLILLGSVFMLTLIVLIAWRLYYFGYPLPNTYYAKVSANMADNIVTGLHYLYGVFRQKPSILLIVLFSVTYLIKHRKDILLFTRNTFILSMILFISLALPLYSGGDHFGLQRYIIPSVLMVFMGGVILINERITLTKKTMSVLLFLIVISNTYFMVNTFADGQYPIRHEWDIALQGREKAILLNTMFEGNILPKQGVVAAGGLAYSYKGISIDLLGLNNTRMAHAKKHKNTQLPKNHASFDKATFYQLRPDIFWYQHSGFSHHYRSSDTVRIIDSSSFDSKVFYHIHKDKKFRELYNLYRIRQKNKPVFLEIFALKTFIHQLDTDAYLISQVSYQ